MSIDFSIKPVGSPAANAVAAPNAAQNAVATQLPASQSVTATDAVSPEDLEGATAVSAVTTPVGPAFHAAPDNFSPATAAGAAF